MHSVAPSVSRVIGSQLPAARQLSQRVRCAAAHSATEPKKLYGLPAPAAVFGPEPSGDVDGGRGRTGVAVAPGAGAGSPGVPAGAITSVASASPSVGSSAASITGLTSSRAGVPPSAAT